MEKQSRAAVTIHFKAKQIVMHGFCLKKYRPKKDNLAGRLEPARLSSGSPRKIR